MIHPTAEVSADAIIGENTRIWHNAQVRERVRIGKNCIIGKGVYVDFDVTLGDNVKVQNYASLYHPAVIEDGVFVGPYVCLTNDKNPRAITPDGKIKREGDWQVGQIVIRYGAALGTGSIILSNVKVGKWSLVAAGAVVTRDVPDHALVIGNPARLAGYVCKQAHRMSKINASHWKCSKCGEEIDV
ncbi:MAG: N-acetyltransferase [Chloroflexi bacterium]|nr:N-acetyltransferase [Chloroflexota bacterium]